MKHTHSHVRHELRCSGAEGRLVFLSAEIPNPKTSSETFPAPIETEKATQEYAELNNRKAAVIKRIQAISNKGDPSTSEGQEFQNNWKAYQANFEAYFNKWDQVYQNSDKGKETAMKQLQETVRWYNHQLAAREFVPPIEKQQANDYLLTRVQDHTWKIQVQPQDTIAFTFDGHDSSEIFEPTFTNVAIPGRYTITRNKEDNSITITSSLPFAFNVKDREAKDSTANAIARERNTKDPAILPPPTAVEPLPTPKKDGEPEPKKDVKPKTEDKKLPLPRVVEDQKEPEKKGESRLLNAKERLEIQELGNNLRELNGQNFVKPNLLKNTMKSLSLLRGEKEPRNKEIAKTFWEALNKKFDISEENPQDLTTKITLDGVIYELTLSVLTWDISVKEEVAKDPSTIKPPTIKEEDPSIEIDSKKGPKQAEPKIKEPTPVEEKKEPEESLKTEIGKLLTDHGISFEDNSDRKDEKIAFEIVQNLYRAIEELGKEDKKDLLNFKKTINKCILQEDDQSYCEGQAIKIGIRSDLDTIKKAIYARLFFTKVKEMKGTLGLPRLIENMNIEPKQAYAALPTLEKVITSDLTPEEKNQLISVMKTFEREGNLVYVNKKEESATKNIYITINDTPAVIKAAIIKFINNNSVKSEVKDVPKKEPDPKEDPKKVEEKKSPGEIKPKEAESTLEKPANREADPRVSEQQKEQIFLQTQKNILKDRYGISVKDDRTTEDVKSARQILDNLNTIIGELENDDRKVLNETINACILVDDEVSYYATKTIYLGFNERKKLEKSEIQKIIDELIFDKKSAKIKKEIGLTSFIINISDKPGDAHAALSKLKEAIALLKKQDEKKEKKLKSIKEGGGIDKNFVYVNVGGKEGTNNIYITVNNTPEEIVGIISAFLEKN